MCARGLSPDGDRSDRRVQTLWNTSALEAESLLRRTRANFPSRPGRLEHLPFSGGRIHARTDCLPEREKPLDISGGSIHVFQEGEECSPPLRQNGAVQARLLPDLPAGGPFRSPGAFGHVPDLQVLDNHDGLGFADRSRGLVEKIQTHVGDPFVGPRHANLLLPDVPDLRPLPVLRIPMKVATDSSQSNGMVRGSSGVGCPLPNGYTARGKKKGEDVRTRLPPDTNQTFSLSKELR